MDDIDPWASTLEKPMHPPSWSIPNSLDTELGHTIPSSGSSLLSSYKDELKPIENHENMHRALGEKQSTEEQRKEDLVSLAQYHQETLAALIGNVGKARRVYTEEKERNAMLQKYIHSIM